MVYLLPFGGPQPWHDPSRDVAATTQDYDVADAIDTTVDVTIGLPVYNGEAYLDVAITGLRTQSYPSFRLLISDNASTDGTEDICREHADDDARIEFVRHPANLGAGANFQFVLDQARTPYFMWAAHDDLRNADYVASLRSALEADPSAALAFGDVHEISPAGESTVWRSLRDLGRRTGLFGRLASLCLAAGRSGEANAIYGLFRTATARDADIAALDTQYSWGLDTLFLCRVASLGGFTHSADATLYKRNYPERMFDEQNPSATAMARFRVWEALRDAIQEQSDTLEGVLQNETLPRHERAALLTRWEGLRAQLSDTRAECHTMCGLLVEYWPAITEYFQQMIHVVENADLSTEDRTVLRVLLWGECTAWLLPDADPDSGRISGTARSLLATVVEAYLDYQAAG
ncbi:hypothetical protein CMK11_06975 [Candidatus Poribacteria bacterium]|nr:hypothetical protein [Candidatus Poribacteria bacterium]